MLCLKRDEATEKLVEEREKKSRVEAARSQHAASMVFVAQLLDPAQLEAAKQHLLEANKVVWVSESSSRTIVAVDGWHHLISMSALFEKLLLVLGEVFQLASDVLATSRWSARGFEVQRVIYRNYGSGPELLLQHSTWAADPADLT